MESVHESFFRGDRLLKPNSSKRGGGNGSIDELSSAELVRLEGSVDASEP